MDLLAAELFTVLAAAEAGSFARAARRLGTEQSTVSRRIRAVEARLGVSLFERWAGGARLTRAGQLVVEEAARCREALEAVVVRAREAAEEGPFRLGFVWSFSAGPAARVLARLQARRPELQPRLCEAGGPELIRMVLARELDCAWAPEGAGLAPGLESAPLWSERLHLVRSAAEPPLRAADWSRLDSATLLCRAADPVGLAEEAVLPPLRGARLRLEAHDCSIETLKGLVEAGRGWLLVPESLAVALPPTLQAAPLPDPRARRRICAVFRRGDPNPAIAEVIRAGREAVAGGDAPPRESAWAGPSLAGAASG